MATINMYVEDIATQKRSGRLPLLPDSVLTQTLIKLGDLLSEVLRRVRMLWQSTRTLRSRDARAPHSFPR